MALSDGTFAAALKDVFARMSDGSKDDGWLAEELAKAINSQIKTADVNPGSFAGPDGPVAGKGSLS
jgi:hypothetical protein